MIKRVLITGSNGLLAKALRTQMPEEWVCLPTTRETMDVLNKNTCRIVIEQFRPDIVFHCAAFTAVDLAEINRSNCYALNVEGAHHVAEACHTSDATMVYFSTDYVFSGDGITPWEVDSLREPCNYYGVTKQQGEDVVLQTLHNSYIVRSSWLFGCGGSNFVDTMLKNKMRTEVRVVEDQVGSPTNTTELASAVYQLVDSNTFGIYHITNEGFCSWADLAEETFRSCGSHTRVIRISSEEYKSAAKRPKNSCLSKTKLDQVPIRRLPSWENGLRTYLANIGELVVQ